MKSDTRKDELEANPNGYIQEAGYKVEGIGSKWHFFDYDIWLWYTFDYGIPFGISLT